MGHTFSYQMKFFNEVRLRMLSTRSLASHKSPVFKQNRLLVNVLALTLLLNIVYPLQLELKEKQIYSMYLDYEESYHRLKQEMGDDLDIHLRHLDHGK